MSEPTPPPIDPSIAKDLIYSFMVVPFPMMQLRFETISSLSKHQIESYWRTALSQPPLIDIPCCDPPFQLPFEVDEDWAILTHMRLNGGKFDAPALVDVFAGYINTSRSLQSLTARAEYLSGLDEDQRDQIMERMAKKLTMEEVYELSIDGDDDELLDFRISRHDLIPCRSANIFDDMEELAQVPPPSDSHDMALLSGLVFEEHPHCLAAFHSETNIYYMKRQGVVIGCGVNCDIDLTTSLARPEPFVSEQQALVYFEEELSFVLENVGVNEILVNGMAIRTHQSCALPENSVIELPGGHTLLFICNLDLIDRIADPEDQGDFPAE